MKLMLNKHIMYDVIVTRYVGRAKIYVNICYTQFKRSEETIRREIVRTIWRVKRISRCRIRASISNLALYTNLFFSFLQARARTAYTIVD